MGSSAFAKATARQAGWRRQSIIRFNPQLSTLNVQSWAWDGGGSRPGREARLDSAYVRYLFLRMRTKLTLYVDKAAINKGKVWARRRKIPLSRVVEDHLNRLTAADAGERFLDKWQGAFKLDPAALKDERVAAIVAKHLR